MSAATTPEPMPKRTDSPAVWPLVIRTLPNVMPDVPLWLVDRLSADMQARHESGVAKYGVPLQADNGRNHAHDAYQEALDGCAYSYAQAMASNLSAWMAIHGSFLGLAASIRYQLALEEEGTP